MTIFASCLKLSLMQNFTKNLVALARKFSQLFRNFAATVVTGLYKARWQGVLCAEKGLWGAEHTRN